MPNHTKVMELVRFSIKSSTQSKTEGCWSQNELTFVHVCVCDGGSKKELMNEKGNALDLVGGFSSSSSIWLVSTWTSKCVSRLTLELKTAARLLQRRGDSELSKYSLSSQDKGLHAEDSAPAEREHRLQRREAGSKTE